MEISRNDWIDLKLKFMGAATKDWQCDMITKSGDTISIDGSWGRRESTSNTGRGWKTYTNTSPATWNFSWTWWLMIVRAALGTWKNWMFLISWNRKNRARCPKTKRVPSSEPQIRNSAVVVLFPLWKPLIFAKALELLQKHRHPPNGCCSCDPLIRTNSWTQEQSRDVKVR